MAQYTKEFKLTIVKLAESGMSTGELSKEYEIDRGTINRWRREHKSGREAFTGHGKASLSAEEKRIRELERQLKDITMERDILKKAVHIFSKKD